MTPFFQMLCLAAVAFFAARAWASPFELRYAGRLTDASGAPRSGSVTLEVKLYRGATDTTPIAVTVPPLENVELRGGLFDVAIPLSEADRHVVFDGAGDVWLEVAEGGNAFARQRFGAV